jgi:hypothetical protein
MATVTYTRATLTQIREATTNKTFDLLTVAPPAGSTNTVLDFTTTVGGTEITPIQLGFGALVDGFITERFAAETDLSGGTFTLKHYGYVETGTPNATFRVKLYRVLRGGTGETRYITSFDGPTALVSGGVGTLKTWNWTIPADTVVQAEERLWVQLLAVPFGGGAMAAGLVKVVFNTTTIGSDVRVEYSNTFTFIPNTLRLIPRSTTAVGIGTYRDLLTTTSTVTTAVVNTAASGTEIQWTFTAGGTAAEWVSGRMGKNFYLANPDVDNAAVSINLNALQSATAANCGVRAKLFRLRNGTETQFFTGDNTTELGTSAANRVINSVTGTLTPSEFLEDDRIVARFYIIPSAGQTMGGARTCTLNYNSSASWVDLVGLPLLKAEADAAASWTVPDGQSTLGVGN